MIHERIVFKNKQSVESIESESFDAEQRFSSRSMKNNRRASIISIEIFEDKFENAKIFYHVRNVDQLKYWLKKDENVLIKAWVNIRDESIFVMNEYNKKVMKFDEFIEKYNDRLNELNDAKLMIRELKIELREKNLSNSNILLFIIEDEIVVSTATRLVAELNFEHVEQLDSIQISNRTWLFVRRIESNLICCSTFELDSYRLFEILD